MIESITIYPGNYKGRITANASKSMMQRVVAAAALSEGTTTIVNPGNSHDCIAAINVARSLGVEVVDNDNLQLTPPNQLKAPAIISCGESGLGIRMFTPILSLLQEEITIIGEGSLNSRPMTFFEEILPRLGVKCKSNDGKTPIIIQGPIEGGKINLDGALTSQFLTGLLMALPLAHNDSTLEVKSLKSRGYVDLTLGVLNKFGIEIENDNYQFFRIKGNQKYQSRTIEIEGDWSGAAFHLVGGGVSGNAELLALDEVSTQPDSAILNALKSAGSQITIGESINIKMAKLSSFQFDATDCPDLFPPLAALAANCQGISVIKGTNRLTHKESNRALTIQNELRKVGINVELDGDYMKIAGGKILGGNIDSNNDHRIAMMGAILALKASNPITITNSSAINKSYPYFYKHLRDFGIKTKEC